MAVEAQRSIRLGCTFSPDGTSVRITIPAEPPVSLDLDTAGIEALLRGFAEVRAKMKPPVPAGWEGGQMAAGVRSPGFVCEEEALQGGSLLHLRHPGLGWLHFAFPAEAARRLGAYLLRQARHARTRPPRAGHS